MREKNPRDTSQTCKSTCHELPAKGFNLFCTMRNIITGKEDDRAKLMLKTMGKLGIERQLQHEKIRAIVAEAGRGWEDAVPEHNESDEKATEGGNTCVGGIEPNGADDGGIEPKKGIEPDGDIDPKSIAAIEKIEQFVNLELERFLHAARHPGSDEELVAILKKSKAVVRALLRARANCGA